MEVEKLTIKRIHEGLQQKEFKAEEITKAYLERIKSYDRQIGAFLTLDENSALETSRQVDQRIARGSALNILDGVPVAVKDNMCTRGLRTTCASKMLEDFVPPYDATVVEALKHQGGVILGKTNMDEFAMGSSNENSGFHPVRNPWDSSRVPGGSSGGSAAAVSAGFAPMALGSDTGGSIRMPAAVVWSGSSPPTAGCPDMD